MSTTADTSVDHEATADFVAKLIAIADDMDKEVPKRTKAIIDAFTAEASVGSRDGGVLPIYATADTTMQEVMGKVEKNLLAISKRIRSDAEALDTSAKKIKSDDEDGAAKIDKTDTDLSTSGKSVSI